MRITVLGTGTSTGVPVPCCSCPVCRSTDKRNRRLRTSLHVEIQAQDLAAGAQPPGTPEHEVCAAIQIDTGPDFRFQALRAGLRRIDAVLYTHTHADHIAGIDDLRGFNFIRNEPIPVYAGAESAAELRQRFGYCFTTSPDYEGGSPPDLTLQLIEPFRPLLFAGFEVLPLPVMHGSAQVLAFRFGPFAYATDCSAIPEQTMAALSGLECLILDGLREREHPTHFSQSEAAEFAMRIGAKQTFLTHISHEVDHERANNGFRSAWQADIQCAYDGLVIELAGRA